MIVLHFKLSFLDDDFRTLDQGERIVNDESKIFVLLHVINLLSTNQGRRMRWTALVLVVFR